MITGLSGAGRSQAADILEDLGWFVIDNLPPLLIPKVSELASSPGSSIAKVVLVVGTGPYHDEVLPGPADAGGTRACACGSCSSRRRPTCWCGATRAPAADIPWPASRSLAEAIEAERRVLEPVKAEADVVVDTTDLNVHQLRVRMLDLFADTAPTTGMQTTITSFGYKHGLPLDTDLVIDCRFLPNPHWVEELRDLDRPGRAGPRVRAGPARVRASSSTS